MLNFNIKPLDLKFWQHKLFAIHELCDFGVGVCAYISFHLFFIHLSESSPTIRFLSCDWSFMSN